MNRASIAMLAVLALSACSKPDLPPPAIETRTVTVDRIVTATCVKASDIPPEPAKVGDKLTGDARRDLDTVSASAMRLRAWGTIAVAMLRGCVG